MRFFKAFRRSAFTAGLALLRSGLAFGGRVALFGQQYGQPHQAPASGPVPTLTTFASLKNP